MLKNEKKKGEILIKEAPENFKLQDTTIWSFLERGNWATHSGKYRGNWSPYIPRNIILRYSKKKDWILDQFLGSGTTLIEAKLLGRNAIGVDINSEAIKLSNKNLNFTCQERSKIFTKQGNANNLSFIKDKKLVKYILKKLDTYYSSDELVPNSFTIEHILPESVATEYVGMIGNLLPLGAQLNNDLSDNNFKSKMLRYPESQYTTVKKFVEENGDKEEWGEKEIVERTKCIANIMYHSIIEG